MAGSVTNNDVEALRSVKQVLKTKSQLADGRREAQTEAQSKEAAKHAGKGEKSVRFAPMLEQLLSAADVVVDAQAAQKLEVKESTPEQKEQVVEEDERSNERADQERDAAKVEADAPREFESEVSEFDVASEEADVSVEQEFTDASLEAETEQVSDLPVVQDEQVDANTRAVKFDAEVEQDLEVEAPVEEAVDPQATIEQVNSQPVAAPEAPKEVVKESAPVVERAAPTVREDYVPTTAKGEGAQNQLNNQNAGAQSAEAQTLQQAQSEQPSETAIRVEADQPTQPTQEPSQQTQSTPVEPTSAPDEYVATTAKGDAGSEFTHTDAAQQPTSPDSASPDSGTLNPNSIAAANIAAASIAGASAITANAAAATATTAGNAAVAAAASGAQSAGVAAAAGGDSAGQSGLGDGSRKSDGETAAKPSQAEKPRFSRVLQDRQIETVRQIAKAISLRGAMAQNGRVSMLLHPEALGSVHIQMNFDQDGAVSVEATVEHAGTRHMLTNSGDELRAQLRQDNIQLQRFDVQQGESGFLRDQSSASNQDSNNQNFGRRAGNSSGGAGLSGGASNEAASASDQSTSIKLGQVNVQA